MVMKKLVKTAIFFLILAVLAGCKTREKAVQKTETQTETKSEATARIEEKTYEIIFDKELSNFGKSKTDKSEETSKTETKNVEIIKEYYENGTLKKEMQRNFSEFAETTKKAISELEEKFTKEKENSRYWENSSNHFYTALEQEKAKTKDYAMQLNAKHTFTWQLFLVGLLVGCIALPNAWKWFKSWLLRFNPYLKLVEKVKKFFGKL